MEGAAHQGGQALLDQGHPAVDEASVLGAVRAGAVGYGGEVRLVVLADVGGVGVWDGAPFTHPRHRDGGVQPAGERDADALADRELVQDLRHAVIMERFVGRRRDGESLVPTVGKPTPPKQSPPWTVKGVATATVGPGSSPLT